MFNCVLKQKGIANIVYPDVFFLGEKRVRDFLSSWHYHVVSARIKCATLLLSRD